MQGLLNINKPPGMTSRDVVNAVQRTSGRVKAGHAGTLDPLASGVLVVCLGAATRLIEYVQQMPKAYSATFLLGRSSPTEDVEGEVTELANPPLPGLDEILAAAAALTGPIQQRPPAYSALKVQGRRAYDLARKGQTVDLLPRTVMIHGIDVGRYEYPELELHIRCGSGTYVRSLGRDLAQSMGTAAVMSQLTRTAIGSFRIEDAVGLQAITGGDWRDHVLPALRAVESLPRIVLNTEETRRVRSGQPVSRPETAVGKIAAVDDSGHLVSILAPRGETSLWPVLNLPNGS